MNIHRDEVFADSPEPEENNCFSINTQVIIPKMKRKSIVKHEKITISSIVRQQLAAILFVEVIIG